MCVKRPYEESLHVPISRPDRQPWRDRRPHRPHGGGGRDRERDGPRRGRHRARLGSCGRSARRGGESLSRHRGDRGGGEGRRLRRPASGLWLSVGEPGLGAGLRGGWDRVRRPLARASGDLRRQGVGARLGRLARSSPDPGDGGDRPRGRAGVPGAARRDHAQSPGRRRRARDAGSARRRRTGRRLRRLRTRSRGGVRRRRALCREAGRTGAAHRGADRRRRVARAGHRRPRLLAATAKPEAGRDRAGGATRQLAGRPLEACRGAVRQLSWLGHRRVPGRGRGRLLPGGQSAPAGRAHGDRGGHGPRFGAAAIRHRGGQAAGPGGPDGLRGGDPGADQCRGPDRRRAGEAVRRDDRRLGAAGRSGRARGCGCGGRDHGRRGLR